MPMVRSPRSDALRREIPSTSKELQCTSCSVIINELLAFINNKVDVLPETAILQICVSAYTSEEIENARSVAYKFLSPTKKYMRRKEGSEQKSVQEIIKLIKEFDPDCLPVFVAKNLNKLPPVSFDHIDVTSFLREMSLLRNDVANIKADKIDLLTSEGTSSMPELETIKAELKEVKSILTDLQTKNWVNNLSKTAYNNSVGVNEVNLQSKCITRASNKQRSNDRCINDAGASIVHTRSRSRSLEPDSCPLAHAQIMNIPTYRDIIVSAKKQVRDYQRHTDNKKDDGFTVVEKKKRKKISNLTGTAQVSTKLQIAELTSAIYVSRLTKTTTVDNIKDYCTRQPRRTATDDLLHTCVSEIA
ncbi:unnamed protein product [Euphydryas editha]|uniref:Uncharacterized protein n=1 Tax=Euphydryas editha TaxID=104508 RepID=A0AAU9VAL0_EUPED|nr:unnamed protein product [Euphydryas editha]